MPGIYGKILIAYKSSHSVLAAYKGPWGVADSLLKEWMAIILSDMCICTDQYMDVYVHVGEKMIKRKKKQVAQSVMKAIVWIGS